MKQIAGFLVFVLLYVVCFSFVVYFLQESKKQMMEEAYLTLLEDDCLFKIIYIDPKYNLQGHLVGRGAIAEGVNTGKRITGWINPLLPIIGEIWRVDVVIKNMQAEYIFVEKISK